MKHLIIYLFIATTALSCRSQTKADCEAAAQTSNFVLDGQAFEAKLNETPGAVLLDVRTPDEYAGGYIRDAKNIDYYADFKNAISGLDKSKTYFVYCKAGSRSASAADIMRQNGFTTVYELKGGIMAWESAGNALTNASQKAGGMPVAEYEQLLKNHKLVLVDFNAKWCGPCKKMAPFLDELSQEYAGKALIQKIDVDENETLVRSLDISALPLLILYKDGQEVWRKNAFASKSELAEQLAANL